MIGVSEEYEKRRIATQLMEDTIKRALRIAEHAGTYALALDAATEELVAM